MFLSPSCFVTITSSWVKWEAELTGAAAELLQLIDKIFPDEINVSDHVRRDIIMEVFVSQNISK